MNFTLYVACVMLAFTLFVLQNFVINAITAFATKRDMVVTKLTLMNAVLIAFTVALFISGFKG